MQLLNGEMKIELSRGKYALVDAVDYPRLSSFKWFFSNGYAVRMCYEGGTKKTIRMHREIMNTPDGLVCDHIDGNGLNNRRINLRNCRHRDNVKNRRVPTGKLKGVSEYRYGNGGWVARIRSDGVLTNIGVFDCKIAAANAYNYHATKEHREFARLNDVPFMNREEWESHLLWKRTYPVGVRRYRNGRYGAYVYDNGKFKTIGCYDTAEEAATARSEYLKEIA